MDLIYGFDSRWKDHFSNVLTELKFNVVLRELKSCVVTKTSLIFYDTYTEIRDIPPMNVLKLVIESHLIKYMMSLGFTFKKCDSITVERHHVMSDSRICKVDCMCMFENGETIQNIKLTFDYILIDDPNYVYYIGFDHTGFNYPELKRNDDNNALVEEYYSYLRTFYNCLGELIR
jgi:hypothetical protein